MPVFESILVICSELQLSATYTCTKFVHTLIEMGDCYMILSCTPSPLCDWYTGSSTLPDNLFIPSLCNCSFLHFRISSGSALNHLQIMLKLCLNNEMFDCVDLRCLESLNPCRLVKELNTDDSDCSGDNNSLSSSSIHGIDDGILDLDEWVFTTDQTPLDFLDGAYSSIHSGADLQQSLPLSYSAATAVDSVTWMFDDDFNEDVFGVDANTYPHNPMLGDVEEEARFTARLQESPAQSQSIDDRWDPSESKYNEDGFLISLADSSTVYTGLPVADVSSGDQEVPIGYPFYGTFVGGENEVSALSRYQIPNQGSLSDDVRSSQASSLADHEFLIGAAEQPCHDVHPTRLVNEYFQNINSLSELASGETSNIDSENESSISSSESDEDPIRLFPPTCSIYDQVVPNRYIEE